VCSLGPHTDIGQFPPTPEGKVLQLLEYLTPCRPVVRTMLLENGRGYHFDPETNVVDVHISKLRQKIDSEFEQPLLRSVRNRCRSRTTDRA
jgi:two-component system OmpR family response regulator